MLSALAVGSRFCFWMADEGTALFVSPGGNKKERSRDGSVHVTDEVFNSASSLVGSTACCEALRNADHTCTRLCRSSPVTDLSVVPNTFCGLEHMFLNLFHSFNFSCSRCKCGIGTTHARLVIFDHFHFVAI